MRVRTYEVVDAALIRATTIPDDIVLPAWPDLTVDDVAGWADWLRKLWNLKDFVAAVEGASPELAFEVRRLIDSPLKAKTSARRPRRLTEAVARYLLRWQSRATPFGLLAGIAPVQLGEAPVSYPEAVEAIRADHHRGAAHWLADQLGLGLRQAQRYLSAHPPLALRSDVIAVAPAHQIIASRFEGPTTARWGAEHHAEFRADAASVNDQVQELESRLDVLRTVSVVTNNLGFARGSSWVVPGAGIPAPGTSDPLCDVEVDLTTPVRLAIEAARRPTAFNDLTARISAAAPEVDTVVIERMLAGLVAHRVLLSEVRPPMTTTNPAAHVARFGDGPVLPQPVTADVKIDCSVTLPSAVLREAELAASTLTHLAPRMTGWQSYHEDFLERYGPDAAVPVRELVGGSGLGYPAGYRGSRRRDPQAVTSRYRTLAKIAQRAALRGQHEVVLDDDLITRLTIGQRTPVPHTELRFNLAAPTLVDLARGNFTLSVVGAARHAGVTIGRFLYLLDTTEQERFQRTYAGLPTELPDAVPVQISVPPLAPKMTAVARVPDILPILPLGEYQESTEVDLDDLAVMADARRVWLVSLSRGCPVEPLLLNAVDLPGGQQPLARFLAEISTALSAPCCPISWGSLGRDLPFLPRIRHGRSILHSARWLVEASELPTRTETFDAWRTRWDQLRDTYRIPSQVFMGADDTRIRLDLDEPAHLVLLRSHLSRRPNATLTEPSGPAGWLQGRAHEIVLTLGRKAVDNKPPRARTTTLATAVEHRPGLSPWLYTKLYGRIDDILLRVPELDDVFGSGWWFIRYSEPVPHLRLRLALGDANEFAQATQRLGRWAERLRANGLLADYTIDTYRPETRFGTGPTLAAAEAVFAADSRLVISRLHGDRTVETSAGMMNLAAGFIDDGLAWLIDHVDHRGNGSTDRPVYQYRDYVIDAVRTYSDPTLQRALALYRTRVEADGLNADVVLGDLLHLHHVRMIGADSKSELYCLRLARTAAQTMLAQGAS